MNVVWKSKLDGIYDVMVISEGDGYKGKLILKKGDVELLNEDTSIAYAARFGPDIFDVNSWENRCIDFIDNKV